MEVVIMKKKVNKKNHQKIIQEEYDLGKDYYKNVINEINLNKDDITKKDQK